MGCWSLAGVYVMLIYLKLEPNINSEYTLNKYPLQIALGYGFGCIMSHLIF
jgi:hypothetical protein